MFEKPVSPKFFFLRFFSLVTLLATLISVMVVSFQLINLHLPDAGMYNEYYNLERTKDSLRSALAWLIVMFPAYLGTLFVLHGAYKKEKSLQHGLSPKWFTYASMFVSALTIIFSLVALVNALLDGEATLRFLLKFGVVFLIALGVFGYHTRFLKRK